MSLDEDVKLWVDKIMELSRKKDSKENRIKILEEKGFSIDYVTKILTNIYEKKESNEKKYNFN